MAQKEAYRHIPKIILTGYPTYQSVREALGPVLDGLPPAVTVLHKQEGLEAMLHAVEEAFSKHVRINWDLVIQAREQHLVTFPHLATLIEPELAGERLLQRAEELEDMLRRLFYDKSQITIERLLWQHAGRLALVIVAFQTGGLSESFVVVCGEHGGMAEVTEHYKAFAPKAPGETASVLSLQTATTHFAAHTYALANADLESAQTLAELYRTGPERAFSAALEGLWQQTLPTWHQNKRLREAEKTLDAVYRERLQWLPAELSQPAYTERAQALVHQLPTLGLEVTYAAGRLTLHLHGQSFTYPDPVLTLHRASSIGQPVLLTNTPGRLSGENILTDTHGKTWLTDFAEAGLAPVLWGAVALEAAMRFDWVDTSDLSALHDMERGLVESPFGRLDTSDIVSALRKPVRAIQTLRRLVAATVGADALPYHLGLAFQALSRLGSFNPVIQLTRHELVRLTHAFLAAAMLCGKIEHERKAVETTETPRDTTGIRIDQTNRAVWVNGIRLPLTGDSYNLLCHLYNHMNQLCTRRELIEQVLDLSYDETDSSQISRLNTAIRRLREKIEDDPSQPQYLLTEPGGGYRLVTYPGKANGTFLPDITQ